VTASGITGAVSVVAGGGYGYGFACALLPSGVVKCWGNDVYGKLGNGTTGTDRWSPAPVTGIGDATAISLGEHHACAVVSGGSVKCWGFNAYGQLGDGTTTDATTPVPVTGVTGAVAVAAGASHTCALLFDGSARCWGDNFWGQLGDGTTTASLAPVSVAGLDDASSIAASIGRTCAIKSGGTMTCWGMESSTPLPISGIAVRYPSLSPSLRNITPPVDIDHYCARTIADAVYCWGSNYAGALGNGTTTNSTAPVPVIGL
jgi:alpha-tubulin suppressor-like RCC1 family protein